MILNGTSTRVSIIQDTLFWGYPNIIVWSISDRNFKNKADHDQPSKSIKFNNFQTTLSQDLKFLSSSLTKLRYP